MMVVPLDGEDVRRVDEGGAPPAPSARAEERRRVAALVARHGADALDHLHLRPDRSYLFAPEGDGVVSYRVDGRVALLGGDPVCAPAARPLLVAHARRALAARGLAVCVVGASVAATRAYMEAGLRAVKLGEEAIIDLPAFDAARLRPKVRRAARHIAARGVALHDGTMAGLDPALAAQCPAVARAWLARHGGVLQGFSMGGGPVPGPEDDAYRVVLAARAGRVLGFVTLAPAPAARGLSLDHMRRLPDAPNGLMEALILHAAVAARDAGAATLSLNFAPFCDEECPEGEGAAIRAVRRAVFRHAPGVPARTLYLFNRKFAPRWACRYWLYGGKREVYAACRATVRAEGAALRLPPALAAAALAAPLLALPDRLVQSALAR